MRKICVYIDGRGIGNAICSPGPLVDLVDMVQSPSNSSLGIYVHGLFLLSHSI
jgi:hypothetical protein